MGRRSTSRVTGLFVFAVILSVQILSQHSNVAASSATAPQIQAVISTKRGNTFDLKILVQHGSRGRSRESVTTYITSNGGRCIVESAKNHCTIRSVRRDSLLTFAIITRISKSSSLRGTSLAYRVGLRDWHRVFPTTTTTTIHLPQSVQGRSFALYSPFDSSTQVLPLVVLLHGYGSNADLQESYMGLRLLAEERRFRLLLPNGTENPQRAQFWNAGPVCCDFFSSGIDDEKFLMDLVSHVSHTYAVDRGRIYLIGHSNGGAMAYRLSCHHPGVFAAVASLAGIGQYEVADCNRSSSIGSLHIHGTADDVVLYNGGLRNGRPYVGARSMIQRMAEINSCVSSAQDNVALVDLVEDLPAAETHISRWNSCNRGVRTELWTIQDGAHIPWLSSQFSSLVYSFLAAHSK